jgi:hypothetical protein
MNAVAADCLTVASAGVLIVARGIAKNRLLLATAFEFSLLSTGR